MGMTSIETEDQSGSRRHSRDMASKIRHKQRSTRILSILRRLIHWKLDRIARADSTVSHAGTMGIS
jgi:hypothetical protein